MRLVALGLACTVAPLMLAGCDPVSLLESPKKAAEDAVPRESAGWAFEGMPSASTYVLSAGGGAITVTPLGVIIPVSGREVQALGASASNPFTAVQAEALAGEIAAYVSNRLAGRTLTLFPEPKKGAPVQALRIALGDVPDIAYELAEKGYAAVAPDAPPHVESACAQRQQSAYDRELGLWRPQEPLSNRLSVEVEARLGAAVRDGVAARNAKPAGRFHSDDLFTSPSGSKAFSAESGASVGMKCGAMVKLSLSGPPRAYDVTVVFEPRVRAQENSGPLSSFKNATLPPVDATLRLSGGEATNLPVEYPVVDLNRVYRADRVAVYTGHIITGYKVTVSADGTPVRTAEGSFDQDDTLRALGR